jgi:hypothetical protein
MELSRMDRELELTCGRRLITIQINTLGMVCMDLVCFRRYIRFESLMVLQ